MEYVPDNLDAYDNHEKETIRLEKLFKEREKELEEEKNNGCEERL